jgi:hypothetical protein
MTSASAQVRIAEDRGGQIGPYLYQYAMLRDRGERVIIDGACLSACTLVLGTVPKERICVTSRANLGFHAAWNVGSSGKPVFSPEGTRLLWEVYPPAVRKWILSQGGLTPKMIYLRGRTLASMYASCTTPTRAITAGTGTTTTTARAGTSRTLAAANPKTI